MNYLIDTHLLVWSILSPKKISNKVKRIFNNSESIKLVSVITLWEISLKYSLGKMYMQGILPDEVYHKAEVAGFEILNLDPEVVASLYKFPRTSNKDPFDRMLAWQAINQDCILLTADKGFIDYKAYGLKTVW